MDNRRADATATTLEVPAGATRFLLDRQGTLLAGALTMPGDGAVELHLEPDGTLRVGTRQPDHPAGDGGERIA